MIARPKSVPEARSNLAPQKLHALLAAADRLTSTLSLSDVLTHILKIGGELTSSEAGSVILHDTEQNDLYFAAATGPSAHEVATIRIPIGKGKAGMVFETGEPIVENIIKDHYKAVDEKTHFVTQSMICVPLRFGDRTFGVLQFMNKEAGRGDYDDADLELTQRLAVQATIAIRNATIFERLLASSGLYARPEARADLIAMVTGEGPRARMERAAVLFADMRGFTLLCERVSSSPAAIQTYLTQFFHMLAGSVLAHGGIVNKFLGDGVLALFRGSDGPLHAVQCAFHMREQFVPLRKDWQRATSRNIGFLDVGVGIATDDVTIGAVGDDKVSDFTIIGNAVNLAAALERSARDGNFVLCDNCTHEAVQPWIGRCEGPTETEGYLTYSIKTMRSSLRRPRIFICHSSADIEQIHRLIVPRLEQHGFDSFLATTSIKIGDKWDQAVVAAIDTCDFFMIVASPNAASSINVSDEIYYAFGRRQEKHPNWIMPVRLYQYRDLMTPRGEADFEALLAEIAQSGREAQA